MLSISFSSEIRLSNRGCSSSYQPFSHKISLQEMRLTRPLAKLFPDGEKSPRKQVVVSPSEQRRGRYCGSTQVSTVGQSLHPQPRVTIPIGSCPQLQGTTMHKAAQSHDYWLWSILVGGHPSDFPLLPCWTQNSYRIPWSLYYSDIP